MITQRVMIVRNYLLVMPFLSIVSARGIIELLRLLKIKLYLVGVYLLVFGLVVWNISWLWQSAQSIQEKKSYDYAENARAYITGRSNEAFCLSPKVTSLVDSKGKFGYGNIISQPTSKTACEYLFMNDEIPLADWNKWLANRFGRYRVVAGLTDVNFDYYPMWVGAPKVVALPLKDALQAGIVKL